MARTCQTQYMDMFSIFSTLELGMNFKIIHLIMLYAHTPLTHAQFTPKIGADSGHIRGGQNKAKKK